MKLSAWKVSLGDILPVLFLLQKVFLGVAAAEDFVQKCNVPLGSPTDADMSRCRSHDDKCSTCIQTLDCQWCSHVLQAKAVPNQHCFPTSFNLTSICEESDISNPCNSMTKIKDEPLSDVNINKSPEMKNATIVQLRPQHVRLRLRKGKPFNISLTYRQIKDYPVDLYYLMDLSKSMRDDKESIAGLGSKLAQTMRKLTSQFRLGFGSFVDKIALPFMNMATEKLKTPCENCESPYTFRNNLPLTDDDRIFTNMVKEIGVSGNLDSPEGGFDALMQAIVCPEIGWRNVSRRIIILSTDAKYNYAGIGKLAGIIEPHDMKCHLDKNGSYTSGRLLDYPSAAQINAMAKKYQVNIIFAVTKYVENLYSELSKMIDYSSCGVLDANSSNVVEMVKEQYEMISSSINLTHVIHAPEHLFSVRYFSTCKNKDKPAEQTSSCTGIKEGDEVEFVVEITAERCPKTEGEMWIDVTTNLENIHIDIDVDCQCDCEKPGAEGRKVDTEECSKSGIFHCGVCTCAEGSYGKKCQCNTNSLDLDIVNERRLCQRENDSQICSGQGTCQCGQCICTQPSKYDDINGVFCECNHGSCRDPKNKIVCSGNGECDCNKCRCHQGWQGTYCECQTDEVCVAPGGMEVCSGHGKCDCGKCTCEKKAGISYYGKYCEECHTCRTGRCVKYRDCVQCKLFGTGKLKGSACNNCTINPEGIESLQGEVDKGAQLCSFVDESDNCEFKFTYLYIPTIEKYSIRVQNFMECPPALAIMGLVFGIIGAVVAVGILTLLIWKIVTSIQDRKEFTKFEEERKKAMWHEEGNPLYQPATSTFNNPAFRN